MLNEAELTLVWEAAGVIADEQAYHAWASPITTALATMRQYQQIVFRRGMRDAEAAEDGQLLRDLQLNCKHAVMVIGQRCGPISASPNVMRCRLCGYEEPCPDAEQSPL